MATWASGPAAAWKETAVPRRNDRAGSQWWLLLLLLPFVGVLWVPFFNRIGPELWGVPFFFWYQFLWVIVSAVLTAWVYVKTAPPRSRAGDSGATPQAEARKGARP